jgi:hypothetical protein
MKYILIDQNDKKNVDLDFYVENALNGFSTGFSRIQRTSTETFVNLSTRHSVDIIDIG